MISPIFVAIVDTKIVHNLVVVRLFPHLHTPVMRLEEK
jgi:hypothetical protein